jgi:uncharacterized protein involved in propanediol utilization
VITDVIKSTRNQVVNNPNVVTRTNQPVNNMAANETRPARNQNLLVCLGQTFASTPPISSGITLLIAGENPIASGLASSTAAIPT